MSDEHYSKNEVDLMLKNMDQKMNTLLEQSSKTLKQVEKTNGRVTALEKWRAYLTGAVAIIMLLGIPNVIELLSK